MDSHSTTALACSALALQVTGGERSTSTHRFTIPEPSVPGEGLGVAHITSAEGLWAVKSFRAPEGSEPQDRGWPPPPSLLQGWKSLTHKARLRDKYPNHRKAPLKDYTFSA